MHPAKHRLGLEIFSFWLFLSISPSVWAQGPLVPYGPPAPTMKTLDQVEPRIPIAAKSLPLTIKSPGSYYFAETIRVSDLNTTGITISSSNVRIDLCGFSLIGPGKDQGTFGSGIAYEATQNLNGIAILNGQITNWRGHGIYLDRRSLTSIGEPPHCENVSIVNITSSFNGGDGIRVGEKTRVSQCQSSFNGGVGIGAQAFSLVQDCTVNDSGSDGIAALDSSIVSRCIVNAAGGCGIVTRNFSTIEYCSVSRVYLDGIRGGMKNVIRSNNIHSAGSNPWGAGDGDGTGVYVSSVGNCIESNNVTESDRGIKTDLGGNLVIKNTATDNKDNYGQISSANTVGPIVTSSTIATNNNPHANYQF